MKKYVKRLSVGIMTMAMVLVCMTGCQKKENSTGSVSNKNSDKESVGKIEWNYDLTDDGKEEKIVVDANSVNDDASNTVEVYSGETGELIWKIHTDDVHANRLSINVFEKDNKSYLLTWDPAMWQGSATYSYKIFNLTEDGTENELESNQITFDVSDCNEEDVKNVIEFSYEVNDKLQDSFMLISTTDELAYSTSDKEIKSCFNPEEEVGSMVLNIYNLTQNMDMLNTK